MPQVSVRLNGKRLVPLKCWFIGHDDLIRRAPGRLYLECFECGRETHGWPTGKRRQANRSGGATESIAHHADVTVAA
jgi:hypothetical protein